MFVKKLGEYLLAKDSNAIAIAFLAALLPVFALPTGFIAVLIVGLVTLQKGPKAGFWVLSWVALPTIALLITKHIGLFDVYVLRCAVIWILAVLLRRFQAWGLVLLVVSLTGIAIILGLHGWNPQLEQWWVTHLTEYMQMMAKDAKVAEAAEVSSELAKQVAPFATGATAFFISLTIVVELAVVRWWQTYLFEPGKFAQDAILVRAGKITTLLAIAFLAMTLMKYPFAKDALPMTLLPLFAAGLSFLHFIARRNARFIYLLIVIYAGFIFLPALVVSAVALIAFVDTWVDFRKRLGTVS